MNRLKTKLNRVNESLSVRYEFLYILRKNTKAKFVFFILLFLFFIFDLWILYYIYKNDHLKGIVENVFPFFVDLIIIIFFTISILIVRALINDETYRITKEITYPYRKEKEIFVDIDGEKYKFLILPIGTEKNIKISIDDSENSFFKMPSVVKNLLEWLPFDKNDYYRLHYGSLDIAKVCVKEISFTNDEVNLNCNLSSFFDIAFTHYFCDYPISDSLSTEEEIKKLTLRNLFGKKMQQFYEKQLSSNAFVTIQKSFKFQFDNYFPNHLGITGIVFFDYKNQRYYFLKKRYDIEAASRNRLQWSFAGTIDYIPNIAIKNLGTVEFVDLYIEELIDEILLKIEKDYKKTIIGNKKHEEIERAIKASTNSQVLGLVLNPVYMFQPEFFVLHNLTNFLSDDVKDALVNSANSAIVTESNILNSELLRKDLLVVSEKVVEDLAKKYDDGEFFNSYKKKSFRELFFIGLMLLKENFK